MAVIRTQHAARTEVYRTMLLAVRRTSKVVQATIKSGRGKPPTFGKLKAMGVIRSMPQRYPDHRSRDAPQKASRACGPAAISRR